MNYLRFDLHKNRFTAYNATTGRYRDYRTGEVGILSFIEDCKRTTYKEPIVMGVESTGNTLYFKRMLICFFSI